MPLKPPIASLLLLFCAPVAACSAKPALPPVVERPAGPAIPVLDETVLNPDLSGDPVAAASAAIRRKDWRFYKAGKAFNPGVRCFSPDEKQPPQYSDYPPGLDDLPILRINPQIAFAIRYNQVIVDAPDYPDADVCRRLDPRDTLETYALAPRRAAREVSRPPLSLHEAARRGTIDDVRRFLAVTRRNQIDRFGMTPLAWAAARGRSDIWAELVRNGESPVGAIDSKGRDDLYWAIATGREDIVEAIIVRTRGELREALPASWLAAAISTGNPRIVDRVFALRHELLVASPNEIAKWQAPAVEAALKRSDAQTAQRVLDLIQIAHVARSDLADLAIRYGAVALR